MIKQYRKDRTLINSFYEAKVILLPKPYKDSNKKEKYKANFLLKIHVKILSRILTN